MSKKRKRVLIFLSLIFILCIVGILVTNQPVFADVGNNNSYDSDVGTSDGDGDGIFMLIYIIFDLFGPIGGLIVLLVIVGVFFVLKRTGKLNKIMTKKANKETHYQAQTSQGLTDYAQAISKGVADEIRQNDPNFSEDAFVGWAREVFMKIQQAWNDRDWHIIRPFESQELFNQHNQQLQEYIKNNKINKVEKICIRYCALKDYVVDGTKEKVVVELHATMRDYVVDSNTNAVLESDPDREWFMKYDMTFNRKKGVLTQSLSNRSTTNCPNCGAPTEVTSAGQCEYCKSIITNGEHDWVLSNIVSRK